MTRDAERRYPIYSHEEYFFYAGLTPEIKQVLMGLACPDLVAFFFDSAGNLLNVEQRVVPFFQSDVPSYDVYDERIPALFDEWHREMGFQPATIKVKKFYLETHYIGIEDYPSEFEEILSDPKECEEEKNGVRESMRIWDEERQFVLLWENDCWLDDIGEVVSYRAAVPMHETAIPLFSIIVIAQRKKRSTHQSIAELAPCGFYPREASSAAK